MSFTLLAVGSYAMGMANASEHTTVENVLFLVLLLLVGLVLSSFLW